MLTKMKEMESQHERENDRDNNSIKIQIGN